MIWDHIIHFYCDHVLFYLSSYDFLGKTPPFRTQLQLSSWELTQTNDIGIGPLHNYIQKSNNIFWLKI